MPSLGFPPPNWSHIYHMVPLASSHFLSRPPSLCCPVQMQIGKESQESPQPAGAEADTRESQPPTPYASPTQGCPDEDPLPLCHQEVVMSFRDKGEHTRPRASSNLRPPLMSWASQAPHSLPDTFGSHHTIGFHTAPFASAVLCLECPLNIYCLMLGAENMKRSPQGLYTFPVCLANS